MFFIKIMPMLVYAMIIKSKSKGLGNPHSYTIACISLLLLIHCFQVMILVEWISFNYHRSQLREPGFGSVVILAVYVIFGLFLSKIYNQKRLRHWYAEYKNRRFLKYSKLIVFTYVIINLLVFYLAIPLFKR
jgi:hypothetical protein